jgi:hypothetical protein
MAWEIEFTAEFEVWWNGLSEDAQDSVHQKVLVLRELGPALGRPSVDTVRGSKHANMKELRVQHAGEPYRVLFAFDPHRCAVLLIGGNKRGDDRWYEEMVPLADRLFDEHLKAIKKEE